MSPFWRSEEIYINHKRCNREIIFCANYTEFNNNFYLCIFGVNIKVFKYLNICSVCIFNNLSSKIVFSDVECDVI